MELTTPNSSNVAGLNNIVGGINQVLVVFVATVELGGFIGGEDIRSAANQLNGMGTD
jgi:hypothetical protein